MITTYGEYEMARAKVLAELELEKIAPTRADFHRPRSGLFTASELHKLLTSKAVRSQGAVAQQYLYEKAFERLTGQSAKDELRAAAVAWGNEHEAAMIAAFQGKTGVSVTSTQVFKKAQDAPFGATLDGETADGGILEGKCPINGGIHLQNLALAHNAEWFVANRFDYYVQCQGAMWAANAPFCWFVSYDPGTSRERDAIDRQSFARFDNLHIGAWKIERNDDFVANLKQIVSDSEKELVRIVDGLRLPY